MRPAPDRDDARRTVAQRGLTPEAVTHLTRDALGTIDFAALAPVKKLLKRYFSDAPWTAADDHSLAELVGPGDGWWRHDLSVDHELEFGWRDGEFRLVVSTRDGLADSFKGLVVPEATPNPRSIRFVTPPIHSGPSRWYDSADGVDDPRVARLFAEFDDVANVLVGPTFVAVGLQRPDRWEHLLDAMLRAITREFASSATEPESVVRPDASAPGAPRSARAEPERGGSRALDQAWTELGSLRADNPADLDRILAATTSLDVAERQVAARLLIEAMAGRAEPVWEQLLGDTSRSVRRATVDAMVDAQRSDLRPLLERALSDTDAWTRWKALRGLADLGVEPSQAAVLSLADDSDFRVRLEVTRALGGLEGR